MHVVSFIIEDCWGLFWNILEVNETMEAGEALLTKENPPIHNNNEQLMDQNNDHVTAGDQLMDNDHLTSVDQITDQLSLLATKRSETEKVNA